MCMQTQGPVKIVSKQNKKETYLCMQSCCDGVGVACEHLTVEEWGWGKQWDSIMENISMAMSGVVVLGRWDQIREQWMDWGDTCISWEDGSVGWRNTSMPWEEQNLVGDV